MNTMETKYIIYTIYPIVTTAQNPFPPDNPISGDASKRRFSTDTIHFTGNPRLAKRSPPTTRQKHQVVKNNIGM